MTVGWLGGWVAGLFGNIANSAPNWVGLGLGAELGNNNGKKIDETT